jgi:hypothetical protein
MQAISPRSATDRVKSPFRVAVISDEITQDFDRACHVVAHEFGMEWIELRSMWNNNMVNLDSKEIAEARRILERYKLQVTDIASPLFKVDWPDAPRSRFSPKEPQFNADFSFTQQDEVLERSIDSRRRSEQIAFAASISGGLKTKRRTAVQSTTSCRTPLRRRTSKM